MSVPTGEGYPAGGNPGGNPDSYGAGYMPMTGRVDFAWLGQAWALFSAQIGVWIGALLLYFLIALVLWFLWAIPTGMLSILQQTWGAVMSHTTPIIRQQNPYYQFARTQGFTLLLAAVNAIFLAGFFRMAMRQARGEPIGVGGIFSAFPQALSLATAAVFTGGLPVLLEALLLGLLHLAHLPGQQAVSLVGFLAIIPSIVLNGLLMFAPLLILDRGANAVDALLDSVRLLKGQWLMGVFFYFVASLIGGLGALFCGVGLLLTYPLFLISIAVGYLALTQPSAAYVPPSPYATPSPGVWPPPPTV